MDLIKIDAAVRDCLDECRHCDEPLRCLAVFALTLRADPAWEEAEVGHFERQVLLVLGQRGRGGQSH